MMYLLMSSRRSCCSWSTYLVDSSAKSSWLCGSLLMVWPGSKATNSPFDPPPFWRCSLFVVVVGVCFPPSPSCLAWSWMLMHVVAFSGWLCCWCRCCQCHFIFVFMLLFLFVLFLLLLLLLLLLLFVLLLALLLFRSLWWLCSGWVMAVIAIASVCSLVVGKQCKRSPS